MQRLTHLGWKSTGTTVTNKGASKTDIRFNWELRYKVQIFRSVRSYLDYFTILEDSPMADFTSVPALEVPNERVGP